MWRAVLFDMDGVLVDSYEAWFRTMNAIAEELAYPAISRESFASGWGQGVQEDVRCFYWNHSVGEIEKELERAYPRQLEHVSFDPQAAQLLDDLRSSGMGTALVTNTPTPLARAILDRGGLGVDAVVGGTDVPRPKPAPDMIVRACELLDVPRDQALVVGDTGYDCESARAAGVAFAGLRFDCPRRIERLEQVLDLVQES